MRNQAFRLITSSFLKENFNPYRQGKEWHDLRSKTQKHLLKPKAVQAYLHPMQDVARDFINKILQSRNDRKEVPDFLEELYKWSLECKYSFYTS